MTKAEAYWILAEIRRECFSVDYVKALGIAQECIEFVDLMPDYYVPVVRCKDCKHKGHDSWCDCVDDDDFFCARGERANES